MHLQNTTSKTDPPPRSAPTVAKKPRLYYPTLAIVRNAVVYQPGVPIRAVTVVVEGEKTTTYEETVVGVQITIADRYEGMGTPDRNSPIPKSLTHKDIEQAGYRPETYSQARTEHSVIVWSEEFGCPVVLSEEPKGENCETVVGPTTKPQSWWDSAIRRAESDIRENLARKAQGGAK